MAKSIRSKVKKRNRTEMRKTVGDPHQKKLQARCTAKLQKAVRFSQGEGITKLKHMLTAAQVANPPTKETSKSGFSFRHPDAPPPIEDDDDDTVEVPAPSTRRGRPRARARSLSDAEASMVDEDTAMDDHDPSGGDPASPRSGTAKAASGAGASVLTGGEEIAGGRKPGDLATKLKKQRRRAKRRNWVEYPAPGS